VERTVNLSSDEYGEFIRCLSILRNNCNDVDIREGIIRQRSNDNASIFEIDLTSLIQDVSFPLTNLCEKLDLLKVFLEQEVEIGVRDGSFSFQGQYSVLEIDKPASAFIDNKFMDIEELSTVFTYEEDKLILDYEFPFVVSKTISTWTQVFNITTIQVIFEGETASIVTRSQSKDQYAKFTGDIVSNVVINNCSSNLVTTPFLIEHDSDIEFKMYESAQPEVLINKFLTKLGEVDVVIYTRSSLVKEED